jgi:chemotaxis protein MotC
MKRLALISAALFVALTGVAAGAAFYFQPALIFGEAKPDGPLAHAVPSYIAKPANEMQARQSTLRLVEQLGAIQDKIIRGDRAALAEQARLLRDIAYEVRQFGPDDWKDYINVRTSLLYVLSGGDAHVLAPLIDSNALGTADQKLAAGIVSFAQGQPRAARKLFMEIDPRSLDVSLVGPFALARASLYLDDNHAKAIELLDDARLACPHTAIDEAAARREIPILIGMGERDRALMLTTSYVREFGKSIYAWKLFRDFAEATAKRSDMDDPTTVDRLAASFDDQDMQVASELFIDVAGEALLQGKLKLARAAADRILKIENAAPETLDKARLYRAAAEAPSADAGDALRALNQITADRLSDDDTEIREVAGFIAKSVVGNEIAAGRDDMKARSGGTIAENPILPKAAAALGKADALLKEADQIIARSEK